MSISAATGGLLFLTAAAAVIEATVVEPYNLRVTELDVYPEELPPELDGLRIMHITDTHIGKRGRREEILIDLCARDADLIVFTGDFVRRRRGVVPICIGIIKDLLRGRKAYGVLGNNDYNPEIPVDDMVGGFGDIGLEILRNRWISLAGNGFPFVLGGVDDPVWKYDRVDCALQGAGENRFKILLAHSPSVFDEAAGTGVDLLLAGHTHGGQICLPGIGALYPNKSHMTQYVSGRFQKGKTILYVSRGVGTTRLPIRFFCYPEVALITLRRRTRPPKG